MEKLYSNIAYQPTASLYNNLPILKMKTEDMTQHIVGPNLSKASLTNARLKVDNLIKIPTIGG